MTDERLEELRDRYDEVTRQLALSVALAYPIGQRCAIIRTRRGIEYEIRGEIVFTPSSYGCPTELRIRTDKRGTIMSADYHDVRRLP